MAAHEIVSSNPVPDLVSIIESPATSKEELLRALARARQTGDLPRAVQAAARLEALEGEKPTLAVGLELVQLEFQQGEQDKAIHRAKQLRERFGNNPHPHLLLARMYVERGDLAAARDTFRKAIPAAVNADTRAYIALCLARIDIYERGPDNDLLFKEPVESSGLSDFAIMMMVRDEGDVMLANLTHHYRMGFRKFFILSNLCSDGTDQIIDDFRRTHGDVLLCRITDDVSAYVQAEKTQALHTFAVEYARAVGEPFGWSFILDADEFLSGPASPDALSGLLKDAGDAQFIVFDLCNGTAKDLSDFDPGRASIYGHFDFFLTRSHRITTKVAFRSGLGVRIAMGNHTLTFDTLDPEKAYSAIRSGFRLAHFPMRSVEQIARKARNGAAVIAAAGVALKAGTGEHWTIMNNQIQQKSGEAEKLLRDYHKRTIAMQQVDTSKRPNLSV